MNVAKLLSVTVMCVTDLKMLKYCFKHKRHMHINSPWVQHLYVYVYICIKQADTHLVYVP